MVEHALTAERPKTRYAVGRMGKAMIALERWLPDRLFDRLVGARDARLAPYSVTAPFGAAGKLIRSCAPPPSAFSARTVAAVRLGHLAHDRQPEAGAGQPARVGGAVEAVEHVRQVGGVDARARGHAPTARRPRTVDLDGPPGGLHLRALSSRFVTARSSRSRSPRTTARLERRLEVHAAAGARAGALDAARRRARRAERPRRLARRLAAARELDEVADQRGQLLELRDQVLAAAARALVGRQLGRRVRAPRCSCAGS